MKAVLFLSFFLFFACGEDTSNQQTVEVASGFYFVSSDLTYSSSNLSYFDYKSAQATEILSGQSGDFVVFQDQKEILLFNRKPEQANFRRLEVKNKVAGFSKQTALPQTWVYDPHDFLQVATEQYLFANFSTKNLGFVSKNGTDYNFDNLTENWDLTSGFSLRPERLLRLKDNEFAFLNQGLSDDWQQTTNGKVFFIKAEQNKIVGIDQNGTQEKIQGLTLKSHLPSFYGIESKEVFIFGDCAEFYRQCQANIEAFDRESKILREITIPQWSSYRGTGRYVQGTAEGEYFAIMQNIASGKYTLIKFDLVKQELRELLSLDTLVPSLLHFAKNEQKLYIGLAKNDGTGRIIVLNTSDFSVVAEIATGLVPYGPFAELYDAD